MHALTGNSGLKSNSIDMGRILGMDVGRKRTGIAVTDPLGLIATALDTVHTENVFEYIESYVHREKVDLFVVGHPVRMDNRPSEASEYIEPFVKKLSSRFPQIPVRRVDERFTSKLAMKAMIDAGIRKKARRDKAAIDRISAVIILQSFIESENNLR